MKVISLFRLVRPIYWSKNFLLFLPLLLCDRSLIPADFCRTGLFGLLLFSAAASSGYIFNDVMDRARDRLSLRRNSRGLVKNTVSVRLALWLLAALIGLQSLLWLRTPFASALILWIYLLASVLYSVFFKNVRWFDIAFLSIFHSLRILFGILLFDLPLSFWLMSFSFFAFLAAGALKRLDEVVGDSEHCRPYKKGELARLQSLVVGSSLVMLGILTAYILNGHSKELHSTPQALFLLIPLFSVWIASWLKVARAGGICDPIIFLFSQRKTYAFVAGVFLILRGAG